VLGYADVGILSVRWKSNPSLSANEDLFIATIPEAAKSFMDYFDLYGPTSVLPFEFPLNLGPIDPGLLAEGVAA
jgi:hypothetical protein